MLEREADAFNHRMDLWHNVLRKLETLVILFGLLAGIAFIDVLFAALKYLILIAQLRLQHTANIHGALAQPGEERIPG